MRLRVLTAIEGGGRWAAALAAGDVASDAAAAARCGKCRGCPAATAAFVPLLGCGAVYCGQPLVDRTGEDGPTCGCLVGYVPRRVVKSEKRKANSEHDGGGGQSEKRTANSEHEEGEARKKLRAGMVAAMRAMGKTRVASEACPRGMWGTEQRAVDSGQWT